MAQYRLNAYDADVFIPEFKGLMQYGDQMGTDLRFSPDCMNVETTGGVLQPAPGLREIKLWVDDDEPLTIYDLYDKPIIMNARMTNTSNSSIYSSYYIKDSGSGETKTRASISSGGQYDAYLIYSSGCVYEAILKSDDNDTVSKFCYDDSYKGIYVTQILENCYVKSWCTYEQSDGDGNTTNVIIMTGPSSGLYIYSGNGQIAQVSTAPAHMQYVARYAERIWGIGSTQGRDKNIIYYSRPFDATDWTGASVGEQPEDVGGSINVPTFDKDKFTALVPFGESLIAFSEQRAWRITGSDPSNFYIQEQYGNGTRFPTSIAVIENVIIMRGDEGLVRYDGNTISPFLHESIYEIAKESLANYKASYATDAIGISNGLNYILSLKRPEGTGVSRKNHYYCLLYDGTDNSVTVFDVPRVIGMVKDSPVVLMLTADGTSGRSSIYVYQSDSFANKSITSAATKWITPWIDFGRKDIQKGGFELYFYPELNTDDPTASVTLKFTMQTEKKKKSKSYVVHALTDAERTADKKHKQKRLHFGGAGRRFRLIIETEAGNTVPWRLIGGIHIIAEIDKD